MHSDFSPAQWADITLLTLQMKTRRLSEVALLRAKDLSPSVTLSLLRPQKAPSCLFHVLWDQARLSGVSAVSHTYPLDCRLQHLPHAREMFSEQREGHLRLQKNSLSSDLPQDEPQQQRQHSVPLENMKSLYHPLKGRA